MGIKMKNKTFQILDFDKIKEHLSALALTESAKDKIDRMEAYMSESEVLKNLRETTEARTLLDKMGTPPIVSLENMDKILLTAEQSGFLLAEQLEQIGITLTAVKRLKDYLCRGKLLELGLPYYEEELDSLEKIRAELNEKIRGGRVDDFASRLLKDLRTEIVRLDDKMRMKAEVLLKRNKECFSDSFITLRNGRLCLPVKKEYKFKISGSVIDKSAKGTTYFVEPTAVGKLYEELQSLKIDEENEEKRILYALTDYVLEQAEVLKRNVAIIEKLDFIFAKGKLSSEMQAVEPEINTNRIIKIVEGRHPFIDQKICVPLDFEMGTEKKGIIITGPNTGGKTVSIKTVGLFTLMAQCGLHVPCAEGNFAMHSQILCDIGDGQNLAENLSTFSAHITNVLEILKEINAESLVILDELGSGTDPTEGMGIAIAILEKLRESQCMFLATTHYPEVKAYAEAKKDILNARMGFDRESLKPLYRLEIGKSGESCALYIAKRLGMPNEMIKAANLAAYGTDEVEFLKYFPEDEKNNILLKRSKTHFIKKKKETKSVKEYAEKFQIGDSVMIYPDKKIGIVCKKADEKGVLQVQLPDKKIWINHKRIKIHVKAEALYPEDYDFSIIFDSVENRKTRHLMNRKGDRKTIDTTLDVEGE